MDKVVKLPDEDERTMNLIWTRHKIVQGFTETDKHAFLVGLQHGLLTAHKMHKATERTREDVQNAISAGAFSVAKMLREEKGHGEV